MRRAPAIVLIVVGSIVLLAVGSRLLGTLLQERRADEEYPENGQGILVPPVDDEIRLAFPRYVDVGESLSVADLGTFLGVESAEETPGAISYDEQRRSVVCEKGGFGFARAQYRDDSVDKNRVQTQIVVCVDETGDCRSVDVTQRLALDLERFLTKEPRGEANFLAQGERSLYGVCWVDERLRLHQGPDMPLLMLRIIDAWGGGVYSLADHEMDVIRRSPITTYTRDELRPPWVVQIASELESLRLDANGTVDYTAVPCDRTPACTDSPDLARVGDLVILGFGVPGNAGLDSYYDATDAATLESFVDAHLDVDWNATVDLPTNARKNLVFRLVGLEVMDSVVHEFGEKFRLREKQAQVGYDPYWQTRYSVASACLPDQRDRCLELDAALDLVERQRIAGLRDEGFKLWYVAFAGADEQGRYKPLADVAPAWDAFEGVGVYLGPGGVVPAGMEAGDVVDAVVRGLGDEIGDTPTIIIARASPMRFAVDGTFCEAEVCVSAFSALYDAYEEAILTLLTEARPYPVQGFALSIIDGGMHFDIREPYEQRGGILLNRVGETGFNNPLLNLWLSR